MQHGHSSGVDVYLVLHGGCIRFQKSAPKQSRPVPSRPFLLVNTGAPASTTGECVAAVAPILKNDSVLLNEFANVTDRFDRALEQNHHQNLIKAIRDNHQLLVKIGVVPKQVQEFIGSVEKSGGAAKICGAGSVYGSSAGTVLVVSDQDISDLVQRYQYKQTVIQGELKGTHVL